MQSSKHNRLYSKIFLLLCFLSWQSCKNDIPPVPESEKLYLFDFKSEVDAANIGCGYEYYERCGDWIKKVVREEIKPLSNGALIKLGEEFHKNHIPYLLTTHEKEGWVEEIVEYMRPHLVENQFSYNTYIVETPMFNAFTIPGGNIYITTGLLDKIDDINALAYIIGHELGHNENDHTRELGRLHKYTNQKIEEKSYLELIKALGAGLTSKVCGKSDELECDIASMYLLYKAGYDPEKALKGIELLRDLSAPKPSSNIKAMLFILTSSHPWSEDRNNCVRSYVEESKVDATCEELLYGIEGTVITKSSPLNIRVYPIKKAARIALIPKGAKVKVVCDCVEQEYRKTRDWLYVQYETDAGEIHRGWVDKQYIKYRMGK